MLKLLLMKIIKSPQNPYLLLTQRPLSTSKTVKAVMLRDWCTWDNDYNNIIQEIRSGLIELALVNQQKYTSVLIQGSGTFSVESVIGSVIPQDGKLLVLANGAYGQRIATIAEHLQIPLKIYDTGDLKRHDFKKIGSILSNHPEISHVAIVHCETTTGMLNPIEEIGKVVKKHNRIYIVDAISSFGGIPIESEKIGIDYLISSANKCIQGVPRVGFIIAKKEELEKCYGIAHSISLDLFEQWKTMEGNNDKWRFTSSPHIIKAFKRAINKLHKEGGIKTRFIRYSTNQRVLVDGMKKLGFQPLLPEKLHSPIITTFIPPNHPNFDFNTFYEKLEKEGFVIYQSKVTGFQCFRIGNIGEIHQSDIERLLAAVNKSMYWK